MSDVERVRGVRSRIERLRSESRGGIGCQRERRRRKSPYLPLRRQRRKAVPGGGSFGEAEDVLGEDVALDLRPADHTGGNVHAVTRMDPKSTAAGSQLGRANMGR